MTAPGRALRRLVPGAVRRALPAGWKARARAWLGIEPWPDLAVRHPIFRTAEYRALRARARVFDAPRPGKPVLERGHQVSYLLARWLAAAGARTVFHVGYASGRHAFYLEAAGVRCAGTDLPEAETGWATVPGGALDAAAGGRLLRVDFFALTATQCRGVWGTPASADVLLSEATFETMLPWRASGVSVAKYADLDAEARRALLHERLPAKLAELADGARSIVLIEPEPDAGGAGAVFRACAARLPAFDASVWMFRPPFDTLFRLSPHHPARQAVYAFVRDPGLLAPLRAYAQPC